MPLSRLSPHSKRKGVARQRTIPRTSSQSNRHLRLWEAIRATRDELKQWREQVNQVDSLFRLNIQPKEEQLTAEFGKISDSLIEHFSETKLDAAHLSLLGLWITENLQSLSVHPFVNSRQLETLVRRWQLVISRGGDVEDQLVRLARNHSFMKDSASVDDSGVDKPSESGSKRKRQLDGNDLYDDEYEDDNVIFDFGWHKTEKQQPASDNDGNDHAHTDHPEEADNGNHSDRSAPGNAHADSKQAHNGADDIDERVNSLEQRLSVDRLFRQLAHVLHPDREQDETRKAEKHELMSQCLKARQEKDINALLTLYCEHVGELPDDLSDNSHDELIQALEIQLKRLQLELHQERFGNPLHTLIVERYAADTSALCQTNIDHHAKSLKLEIRQIKALGKQLLSRHGLMQALQERREIELDKLSINELTGMKHGN